VGCAMENAQWGQRGSPLSLLCEPPIPPASVSTMGENVCKWRICSGEAHSHKHEPPPSALALRILFSGAANRAQADGGRQSEEHTQRSEHRGTNNGDRTGSLEVRVLQSEGRALAARGREGNRQRERERGGQGRAPDSGGGHQANSQTAITSLVVCVSLHVRRCRWWCGRGARPARSLLLPFSPAAGGEQTGSGRSTKVGEKSPCPVSRLVTPFVFFSLARAVTLTPPASRTIPHASGNGKGTVRCSFACATQ
jgi:hypothetical protein